MHTDFQVVLAIITSILLAYMAMRYYVDSGKSQGIEFRHIKPDFSERRRFRDDKPAVAEAMYPGAEIIQEAFPEEESVEALQARYRQRLEALSGMSMAEAQACLKEEAKVECADEILEIKHDILGQSEEQLKAEARRIMVDTLQRFASITPNSITATLVKLPNEEMKGRIIGREGRNIHSFEAVTGTTLMIDETPGTVLVSSFDPVRRETAKVALERLIQDGRIHPASIESAVEEAEKQVREDVVGLGEEAVSKLKIRGLRSELVRLLGKLHYYLSNNQRTLEHSIEVAYFCSIMASEIGLDPHIAKRAGLLHDIGKAMSHDYEGSHAQAAALLLKGYGEDPIIVNAVACSHGEVEPSSPYAVLVQVADSLSSTRPGARSESMDGYLERINSLEKLARSFDGVKDVYALRAGREIRIIVSPSKVSDAQASQLSRKIRQRIENEFNYPDSIKVTVIREQRFTETAT